MFVLKEVFSDTVWETHICQSA